MYYTEDKKRVYRKKNRYEKRKEQFRNSYREEYSITSASTGKERVYSYECYPFLRNYCFKRFSTKQERSLFLMHELEYEKEYGLKLRRRRSPKNLPNSWDDIHTSVRDTEKSWKHSTKRKRQYYK
jgi:hypothetical protein